MDGIFFIDKPKGVTSRDVVNTIIRKTETRKVGHTGTLDPLATGVLVVCVGKATKLVEHLTATDKEYVAEVCLGIETDTLDSTGNTLKEEQVHLTEEEIDGALNSFVGSYCQTVPKYSAVKINGKKLYEYAREGIEVTLPSREVSIHHLKRISPLRREHGHITFSFSTRVSKGTYIRSLIQDIANKLGTVGIMTELRRTKQGEISIQSCKPLDDIHLSDLKPISEILTNDYQVVVDDMLKKDVLNGKILKNIYNREKVVFVDKEGYVLAIYRRYEKDKTMMKPDIMIGGKK